ncbi:MAG: glycosyltransferase family 2 protein [Candidatus Omnitrophica bacterium]|nr:glycosyltransferase family 2 protein [Candidatus Omnitrophota bacterium]
MPAVSAIIPTYNRAAFLKEAMASIQAQTFTDWELIVVDDGSTDATREVVQAVQRRDPRVRYLFQSNRGGAEARNAALERASGSLVAFLDDDDTWLPEKLARQVAVMTHAPERVGLVACGAYPIAASGECLEAEWPDFGGLPPLKVLLRVGCVIRSLSGVMVRRSCVERVGRLNAAYRVTNDYEWYLRLARIYDFLIMPEPLYQYRYHPGNISGNGPEVRRQLIQLLEGVTPGADWLSRHVLYRRLALLHYESAAAAVDRLAWAQAAWHCGRAIAHDPLVGARIRWGRWANPVYRTIRPYGALLYFTWASLRESPATTTSAHAKR